jgi:hypothetical protein
MPNVSIDRLFTVEPARRKDIVQGAAKFEGEAKAPATALTSGRGSPLGVRYGK